MRYEGAIYRPPSEAESFILQGTVGCSHNLCTYCGMYRAKSFRVRELKEILADVDEVAAERWRPSKVFVADGDSLVMPMGHWVPLLRHLRDTLGPLRRVSCYASSRNVLEKTPAELKELRDLGLDLLYLGPESGDPTTLKRIVKGDNRREHCRQRPACLVLPQYIHRRGRVRRRADGAEHEADRQRRLPLIEIIQRNKAHRPYQDKSESPFEQQDCNDLPAELNEDIALQFAADQKTYDSQREQIEYLKSLEVEDFRTLGTGKGNDLQQRAENHTDSDVPDDLRDVERLDYLGAHGPGKNRQTYQKDKVDTFTLRQNSIQRVNHRAFRRALFALSCDTGPTVSAEWTGGQILLIVEIAYRVVRPGVAHGNGFGDLIATDYNRVAINLCIGPDELSVGPGDCKTFQLLTAGSDEAAGDMIEAQGDSAALDLHRLLQRSRIDDILFVGLRQSPQGQALADILFVLRVNVLGLTYVDDRRHPGIGQ